LETTLSRRDAHKLRTTRTLRDAAFELFLAHGYDTTTTDQIAAKAGVSTRTFFRYFDAKDEVLFQGQRSWSETVSDLLKRQPADLSPMDALCEALIELARGTSREALVRYERIIKSSVTLRGRSDVQQTENAQRVAEGLAERRGLARPDEECRVMALVGLMLNAQAVAELREGTKHAPIETLIREKFGVMERIYSQVVADRAK
jgi:AcrR family transcriptional regulator